MYDCHTLVLELPSEVPERELVKAIEEALRRSSLKSTFRLKAGPRGEMFMWVSNPAFYFLLTNHNPDGTERFRILGNNEEEELPPLLEVLVDHTPIKISRACLYRPGKVDTSQLCFRGTLPTWLNRDLLRKIFSPYSTTSYFYPQIRVSKNDAPALTVKYDPHTNDALAAKMMLDRSVLSGPHGSRFYLELYHPQRDFKNTR